MRPRHAGLILTLLQFLLLISLPQSLFAQNFKQIRKLVFQRYEGEVLLSVPGNPQLVRLQRDTDLKVKDLLSFAVITNEGWVQYALDQRLFVTQESDTLLTFEGTEGVGRGFALRLTLERGTTTFYADPGRNNTILIQAGDIELRVTRKARVRIDAELDSTQVTVFDGKVKVASAEGIREVAKGFTLTYRAGSLTRLAQRKRPARTYGSSYGGLLMTALNFYSTTRPCDPYFGIAGLYGGGDDCMRPYERNRCDIYSSRRAHFPPVVRPQPAPPSVTPRPTRPGPVGIPRKHDEPRELIATNGQVRAPAGTTMTVSLVAPTINTTPSRTSLVPEVYGSLTPRAVVRDDTPLPRRIGPVADRVDVQPIPRERPDGRGEGSMRVAGNPGARGDSHNRWSGSSGSESQGSSPSSGSGVSDGSVGASPAASSSGSSAPAASPPAAPPAAPAAPAPAHSENTGPSNPRTGKPD